MLGRRSPVQVLMMLLMMMLMLLHDCGGHGHPLGNLDTHK
jgi:hypothetical protein